MYLAVNAQAPDWVAQCQMNRTTLVTEVNLPNCLVTAAVGADAQECFKCDPGYTQDAQQHCITLADAEQQGICVSVTDKPAGTDECSQCDHGQGSQCGPGMALAGDGTCVHAIPNCDTQDCDGKCIACNNDQFLATDANVCVEAIDHCKDYLSNGDCDNCKDTQVEVANDLCCPEIKNCKVYGDTCDAPCKQICDEGEIENHNDVCVQEIDHCANQHDNGDCHYCESGYQQPVKRELSPKQDAVGQAQCKSTCQSLDGMLPCVTDQTQLDELMPLIHVWVGLHQPGGGITAWEWEDGCDSNQIKWGKGEPNNSGNKEDCAGVSENHKGFNDWPCDNQKLQCQCELMVKNNQMCVAETPNCKDHLTSGECHACKTGQVKITDDSNSKCVEEVTNCDVYDYATGLCTDCISSQVIAVDANVCVSDDILHCETQDASGDCFSCDPGYLGLTPTSCSQDIPHCRNVGCDGTCESCQYGYIEMAGTCIKEIPNCNEQSANGDCSECDANQTLINSNSQCEDSNKCDRYNCDGKCVKCLAGHTLTNQGVCTNSANELTTS